VESEKSLSIKDPKCVHRKFERREQQKEARKVSPSKFVHRRVSDHSLFDAFLKIRPSCCVFGWFLGPRQKDRHVVIKLLTAVRAAAAAAAAAAGHERDRPGWLGSLSIPLFSFCPCRRNDSKEKGEQKASTQMKTFSRLLLSRPPMTISTLPISQNMSLCSSSFCLINEILPLLLLFLPLTQRHSPYPGLHIYVNIIINK